MSTGINRPKPRQDDWLYSDEELLELEDWLESEVAIKTGYDVPYTAGYNTKGTTVYIDKEVPHFYTFGKVKLDLWKAFALHEMVEVSLEAEPYYMPYQYAHQCALRIERAYIEAVGVDWEVYNKYTTALCDKIYARRTFEKVPKDLDLEPYKDEDDHECLKKMGKE